MMIRERMTRRGLAAFSVAMLLTLLAVPMPAPAQTQVKPGRNFFSIQQDIEFGQQAAAEIERQMPMVNDSYIQQWIDRLGSNIVQQSSMPELPWRFRVANSSEINAFALPGGFVYINRGLIEIAETEAEVAGVMAHEAAHIVLRHSTNQLSRALMYQAPLAVLGSLGGVAGVIGQIGGGVLLPVAFLKFSRDAESQADILGTQLMVKAGYDPQGMVGIFQKLQQSGGRGGPEFLSSHPNPTNRIARIEQESRLLNVPRNPVQSTREFASVQSRLRSMGAAPRVSPRANGSSGSGGTTTGSTSRPGEPPSRSFRNYSSSSGLFRVGYPSNWGAYSQTGINVTFAPEWAIEGSEITRGAIVSYLDLSGVRTRQMTLDQAMNTLLQQVSQSNPHLREIRGQRYSGNLAGQRALATFMSGRNPLGYNERVWVIARPSGQGVVYLLFISPEQEFNQYRPTFQQMIQSFAVNDRAVR